MPVTDEYFALLSEAKTPADVAALMEMHAADLAERQRLLDKPEESASQGYVVADGTIVASGVIAAIRSTGQEMPGYYDGTGRRA